MGDTKRNATSEEVQSIKRENIQLKQLVADQLLKVELYKKLLVINELNLDEP